MRMRDELIRKLDDAYHDFRSAIDGLDEPQFEKKWLDGSWGAREITAHLTGWLGQLSAGLERMGRGERPQVEGEEDWSNNDAWNAKFADHAKGKRHDQIISELEHGIVAFKTSAMLVPEERYGEGKTANKI